MLCRELIVDTSSIINIIHGSIAEPCLENIDPSVEVTPTIEGECHGKSDTSVSLQRLLELKLLEKSKVAVGSTALVEFMEKNNLGAGESEAILTCQQSGRHLWCDDRRARRVGGALLGEPKVTGTLGIMRDIAATGALKPDLCFAAYEKMRAAGSFLPVIAPAFFATVGGLGQTADRPR